MNNENALGILADDFIREEFIKECKRQQEMEEIVKSNMEITRREQTCTPPRS